MKSPYAFFVSLRSGTLPKLIPLIYLLNGADVSGAKSEYECQVRTFGLSW
jgi:hypothetical protein